jgi:hypothetical protein
MHRYTNSQRTVLTLLLLALIGNRITFVAHPDCKFCNVGCFQSLTISDGN